MIVICVTYICLSADCCLRYFISTSVYVQYNFLCVDCCLGTVYLYEWVLIVVCIQFYLCDFLLFFNDQFNLYECYNCCLSSFLFAWVLTDVCIESRTFDKIELKIIMMIAVCVKLHMFECWLLLLLSFICMSVDVFCVQYHLFECWLLFETSFICMSADCCLYSVLFVWFFLWPVNLYEYYNCWLSSFYLRECWLMMFVFNLGHLIK